MNVVRLLNVYGKFIKKIDANINYSKNLFKHSNSHCNLQQLKYGAGLMFASYIPTLTKIN